MTEVTIVLLSGAQLERAVSVAVSEDCHTDGPVRVSEGALENTRVRMEAVLGAPELGNCLWGEARLAVVIQVIIAGVTSVAVDPVLQSGDNPGFAFVLTREAALANNFILDEDSEFQFRVVFASLSAFDARELPEDLVADLRTLLSESIHGADDQTLSVTLTSGLPGPGTELSAFVAPPMSGVPDEDLIEIREQCDEIEAALRACGITHVYQPIRYADPIQFPDSAADALHNRRTDVDNILASDLVVVLHTRRASGLGTVLAWAERGSAAQLILTSAETAQSPLPRSSRGVQDTKPYEHDSVERIVADFVHQNFGALTDHLALRQDRVSSHTPDLRRFRDAYYRSIERGLLSRLPQWFTRGRLMEILRTVDHFAVATSDERGVMEQVFDLGINGQGTSPQGLGPDDVAAAVSFSNANGVSDADLVQLLEAGALQLQNADQLVVHRRQSSRFWAEVWEDLRGR